MHDDNNSQYTLSRNSVLPLRLSLSEVFDYLGLGSLSYTSGNEIQLIERINDDRLPIRIQDIDSKLANKRLIHTIALQQEKSVLFSNSTPFTRDNIYKVISVIDDAKNNVIDVSHDNICITHQHMFATRDEITAYFRRDIQMDFAVAQAPKSSPTPAAKPKSEPIMEKRYREFDKYCKKIAQEKNLPNDTHQSVYESFKPLMTRKDFYSKLFEYNPKIFNCSFIDFFRDKKRVQIEFSKGVRHR